MTQHTTDHELAELLQSVEQFVEEQLYPLEPKMTQLGWSGIYNELDRLREQVKNKGWWLPQIEKEHGGMGLGLHDFGKLSAVLGKSPFGHYVFNCQAPDAGNMEILVQFGTKEQKERYLQPLLNGEIRSCFSMTEPEFAGSNPVMMGTTAVEEEGNFTVNGRKWFTTGADGASFAIVMCVTDPSERNPYQRASQIIVPTDTGGFNHLRKIPIMGEEGSGWASHSEIRYKNCKVPIGNLLGDKGAGFSIAQERLGPGRIHHCMRWMGICDRAFDMMCKRAVKRQIGIGKPLASKQTIQNWIAESKAEIKASKLMVLDTAKKIEQEGAYAAKVDISTIKFYCANVLQKVLDRAVQVHGALGITDDTVLSWWYRHERGARIYDGPDEVHKSSVAKQILKQYQ